jgi:TonB family protein
MMQLENKNENSINPHYDSVRLIFIPAKTVSNNLETLKEEEKNNKTQGKDSILQNKNNKTQLIKQTHNINLTKGKNEGKAPPTPKERPSIPLIIKTTEALSNSKENIDSKNRKIVISTKSIDPIQNTYSLTATKLLNIDGSTTNTILSNILQSQRNRVEENRTIKPDKLKQILFSENIDNKIKSPDVNRSENEYNITIRAILHGNHRYPHRAVNQKKSGTATLSFTLLSTGMVNDSSITSTSGHKILDRAAITMLKRSTPFPPFPTDINKSHLDFIIPVEFKLNNHSTYIKY